MIDLLIIIGVSSQKVRRVWWRSLRESKNFRIASAVPMTKAKESRPCVRPQPHALQILENPISARSISSQRWLALMRSLGTAGKNTAGGGRPSFACIGG
jgi:hypothetical protein